MFEAEKRYYDALHAIVFGHQDGEDAIDALIRARRIAGEAIGLSSADPEAPEAHAKTTAPRCRQPYPGLSGECSREQGHLGKCEDEFGREFLPDGKGRNY